MDFETLRDIGRFAVEYTAHISSIPFEDYYPSKAAVGPGTVLLASCSSDANSKEPPPPLLERRESRCAI